MAQKKLRALFLRLGGEDPVKTILLDFYRRMSRDLMIGFFFKDFDPDAIAMKQFELLWVASGFQPVFMGKSAYQAHLELPPILTGHFDRRLQILRETLEHHSLTPEEVSTWVEFENAFRGVVVHQGAT